MRKMQKKKKCVFWAPIRRSGHGILLKIGAGLIGLLAPAGVHRCTVFSTFFLEICMVNLCHVRGPANAFRKHISCMILDPYHQ